MDQILLDIHTFLLTHPHQMWKNRADDTPLRTIKTILYTLGKLKKQEVSIKLRVKEICHGFLLDYEQSLFPLRDRRGKRTSERARKSPGVGGGGKSQSLGFCWRFVKLSLSCDNVSSPTHKNKYS